MALVIDHASGIGLGTTSYSSNSQTFYFEEVMSIAVPCDAMPRIANAKKLTFQLGTRTVRDSNDQLPRKAMAAMMNP